MITQIISRIKKAIATAAVTAVGIYTLISEWDEMMAERYSECVNVNREHVVAEKTRNIDLNAS